MIKFWKWSKAAFAKLVFWFGLFWVLVSTVVLGFVGYVAFRIPSATTIKGCVITKMFEVELCPGSKNYLPLAKISKNMQRAVITSEDDTFYQHQGFNWEALQKSARENLEKGVYKRGGSTITQQLAKNMFLSRNKSLFRKFLEALITIKIEKTLTKNEILERYLNVVEFGPKIYGIKAASQIYFKKQAAQLNVLESAFLAMLLPNPIKYSRSFQLKSLTRFARRRILAISRSMYLQHKISESDYQTALVGLDYFFEKNPPPRIQLSEEELQRAKEDEADEDLSHELNRQGTIEATSASDTSEQTENSNTQDQEPPVSIDELNEPLETPDTKSSIHEN